MAVKNFPKAEQELLSMPASHPMKKLSDRFFFTEELELFLSLKEIQGFEDKRKDLLYHPSFTSENNNEGAKKWASFCGELKAVWLLTHVFGMQVMGFDQPSPRRQKLKKKGEKDSDCDVKVRVGDREFFVEVKTKCSEESQEIPLLLEQK